MERFRDYNRLCNIIRFTQFLFRKKFPVWKVYNKKGDPTDQSIYYAIKISESAAEIGVSTKVYLYAIKDILSKTSEVRWSMMTSNKAKLNVQKWVTSKREKIGKDYESLTNIPSDVTVYKNIAASLGGKHTLPAVIADISDDTVVYLFRTGEIVISQIDALKGIISDERLKRINNLLRS